MNKKRVAVIDLGTYNCRLSIADIGNNVFNTIYTLSKPLNLGKNLVYRGEFDKEVIQRTVLFFQKMASIIKQYDTDEYRCIATEACRKSINAKDLINEIKLKSDLDVEIITAEEEANLCLKSCSKKYLKNNKNSFVFDIGGGSTELILYSNKNSLDNFDFVSLPYGVLNLDEYKSVFSKKKVIELIDRELSFFKDKYFKDIDELNAIGCCVTATSLAIINKDIGFYKKSNIDKLEISYKAFKKTSDELLKMTEEEKKDISNVGSNYKLLDNGNLILSRILNIFIFKKIIFSDNGLRSSILKNFLES